MLFGKDAKDKILAIVVGGGPAPGINGVISSATIEAINDGWTVFGVYDGFKWLADGDIGQVKQLAIADVSRIHFNGGSIIRTSRANPTKKPEQVEMVVRALEELGVTALLTIGGDDTAFSAWTVEQRSAGRVRVVHVPKTIDNDLPLPGGVSTFGFQTARHVGTNIIRNIMEDAMTTGRWYLITAMGRKTGHLTLGICKAAGATLAIISEEFPAGPVRLSHLCDILECSILKRKAMGRNDGVAILAEGILERLDPEELKKTGHVEYDDFGNLRLRELDLGKLVRDELRRRFAERGESFTIIDKEVGYELRCAPPIPFDIAYTRELGFGAVKFLRQGGSGAMICIVEGKLYPIPLAHLMDHTTGRISLRYVDCRAETYEVARRYMIRLNAGDLGDAALLEKLAAAAKSTPEEFRNRYGYLVQTV